MDSSSLDGVRREAKLHAERDALRAEVAKYRGMEVENAGLRTDNEGLRAEVNKLMEQVANYMAEVAALKASAVHVFWSDDDQMWIARLSDNHGVSGLGTTRAWALRQLSDAVALLDKGE